MASVFIRTLLIYIILMGTMRLMGKRQLAELELSELVTTLMLSELAVIPMQDNDIPLSYAIIPILLLLSVEVILSFLLTKSNFMKKLLLGKPSILIRKGKLDQRELARLRMDINELLSQLRQQGIADIADADYAILEDDGKLSAFKKGAPPSDQNSNQKGIAHPIILDGHISEMNLKLASKNLKWIEKYLREHKLALKQIFLMTIDDTEHINIIMKDN